MRVTVLGATGGLGGAITHELHTRGHTVVAASRRITPAHVPDGVAVRPTDLTDRTSTQAASADAEVVVMAGNLPYHRWATDLDPMVDSAFEAAVATGARFVMVDNLYAYGSAGTTIADASPEATTTRKGRLRRDLGRRLLAAHHDGVGRVALARPSDYYGPGPTQSSFVNLLGIQRALDGKTPRAFIDADQPHTFHYLPDAARSIATLVERPEADGRSWILPAAPAITQRELLELVAVATGRPPKVGVVTRPMLWLAGLANAQLREAREMAEQFDRPYVTRADDFEATFGPFEATPHDRAVAETVDYFRDLLRRHQVGQAGHR